MVPGIQFPDALSLLIRGNLVYCWERSQILSLQFSIVGLVKNSHTFVFRSLGPSFLVLGSSRTIKSWALVSSDLWDSALKMHWGAGGSSSSGFIPDCKLKSVMATELQKQKQQESQSLPGGLQNISPNKAFPLHRLISSGICLQQEKANRVLIISISFSLRAEISLQRPCSGLPCFQCKILLN